MPIIETARLYLRSFAPTDLDDYHAHIYSDADVTRYLPGGAPRSRERTNEVLEFAMRHGQEHGFTLWAVINKADERFTGHCGLVYLRDSPEVEVAYALGKMWWGQGIAAEAAAACLHYGFEKAELDHILALAVPENTASQRVMQKSGCSIRTSRHNITIRRWYCTGRNVICGSRTMALIG
jgi:RimJ/RimL family protein N-acetyltransferase